MKEQELQTWVKGIVEQDDFIANIRNLQQIKDEISEENRSLAYPQFPIDSSARRKALLAAQHVLEQLQMTMIVAETVNVSLRRSERLYPDFVLFNPERSSFVIIELKTSAKTEREAVTELIGYEHELQNQFPFLSGYDVSFVLIATDYSTLLDHSASSLVTWGNRKLLCLRAITDAYNIQLDIHLPVPWTALGQNLLPHGGLATANMCLYFRDGLLSRDNIDYLDCALSLIGEQGDRNNVHGFALLWKTTHPHSKAGYAITIATLNSFAFVSHAQQMGFKLDARIYAKLVEDGQDPQEFSPDSIFSVATNAEQLLSEIYQPAWEGLHAWEEQRQLLARSAFPVRFRFFGALGEFTTQLILNPETRKFFLPGMHEGGLDPGNPTVAIQIIDRLVGSNLFRRGRFGFRDIASFGILMGALGTLTKTADPNNPKASLWGAVLLWRESELLSAITEVSDRCRAMVAHINLPPELMIGWRADRAAKISALGAYSRWFAEDFLTGDIAELHRRFFLCAQDGHGWFDEQIREALSREDVELFKSRALKFLRWASISLLAPALDDPGISEEVRNEVARVFSAQSSEIDDLKSTLNCIDDSELLNICVTDVGDILDLVIPPIFHRLSPPDLTGANWTWIREQVSARHREGVTNVGVIIEADGTLGIGEVLWPSIWSPSNAEEVLLQIDAGGIASVVVTTWSELKSGKFPQF